MNVKNGFGPLNVEHSLMSALHGMQPPPRLTNTSWPSPDDNLNSYNSPQLSVEVGVTTIEAYGRTIDVQLMVSLLDGEDHRVRMRMRGDYGHTPDDGHIRGCGHSVAL
jgi:hypothetical protein